MACQVLTSPAVSRHYSQRTLLNGFVLPSVGMSVSLSVCLSNRTSTGVYFVSSNSSIPCWNLCICFVHELMCMWLGHYSFFHLTNLSILGISDAVNGYFVSTTPLIVFNSWCISVLSFIILSWIFFCKFCPGHFFTHANPAFDWRQRAICPALPNLTDWRQHTKILHLDTFLTICLSTVGSSHAWCTCEICNVLLVHGQVDYLRNHQFSPSLIKRGISLHSCID